MTRPNESPECRCEGCRAFDQTAIDAAVTDMLGGPDSAQRLVGITTPPNFVKFVGHLSREERLELHAMAAEVDEVSGGDDNEPESTE